MYGSTNPSNETHDSTGWLNGISVPIKVYPNPSSSEVNIEVPANMIGSTLELMSLSGLVLEEHFISKELTRMNISGLNAGLYFVRVKGGAQLTKLVKI